MRITKKLLMFLLVLCMLCSSFAPILAANSVSQTKIYVKYTAPTVMAGTTSDGISCNRYFYEQLEPTAKRIYDAMVYMYENGIFERGEDYDITNYVSSSSILAYAEGDPQLLYDYGAARDAFKNDNPDVFWVDFSALSMRGGTINGRPHAFLGIGKYDTYFLPGFTTTNIPQAIREYEAALERVVTLAKEAKPAPGTENEDPDKTKTTAVHKYIVQNMLYGYEDEVDHGNARTAYDCLIHGEGVCEAYTRGFKAVLDRLEIPCICVNGVYKVSDDVFEDHIWNYVQIDGVWYGVDVTHDDPRVLDILSTPKNKIYVRDKNSGSETEEYLLVGEIDLAPHHIPSGIMSPANYVFTYPELALESLRGRAFYNDKDFNIYIVEDQHTEGEYLESGTFYFNYKNKNYTENARNGEYLLARFATYDEEQDEWNYTDWGYITAEIYDGIEPTYETADNKEEFNYVKERLGGNYLKFVMPHIEMVQLAVTNIKPDLSVQSVKNGSLYYDYYGADITLLSAMTEQYENIYYDGYKAPPYPKKVTPYMSGKLSIGGTYHVTAIYDQPLKLVDPSQPIGISLYTRTTDINTNNSTAEKYSKFSSVHFDGDRTLTFDFTPSVQFADDCIHYNIHFTNIVAADTDKELVNISYFAGYPCSACAYKSEGYDFNVFGQPQLLETSDIATGDWIAQDIETGDETDANISSKITHRLTLVTTEPSEMQSKEMMDELLNNDEIGLEEENILQSNTYNIKLTLCKKQIIRTGDGVRVSVGFPQGFDYDSSLNGVTFKAYHYLTDSVGNITGVEEIPLTVTPYGLVILVDSFSPFTIAAVKEDKPVDTAKTVILGSSANGSFYNAKGEKLEATSSILTLDSKADNTKITIKADNGYVIDAVTMDLTKIERRNGENVSVEEKQTIDIQELAEHDIILDYSNLSATTVINAEFIPEVVKEQEDNRNDVEDNNHQDDDNPNEDNPSDDDWDYEESGIQDLYVESYMKENDELDSLAVSLTTQAYDREKGNQNIHALDEEVVYVIDFKNGGKATSKKITIQLELPLAFSVVDSAGASVSKKNKTLTWTFKGLDKEESGTIEAIVRYTSLGNSSTTYKTVTPKVTMLLDGKEKDSSSVINLIIRDFDETLKIEHGPYMFGDLDTHTFRPDDTMTRAECAIVFARVFELPTYYYYNQYFTDLEDTSLEAQKSIATAYAYGLIQGDADRKYRPNEAMTRGEFMTILARQIENQYGDDFRIKDENELIKVYRGLQYYMPSYTNYDPHWSNIYVTELIRLNMTPLTATGKNLRVDDPITRAEVTQFLNYYLFRTPVKTNASVRFNFMDVPRTHALFGDIVEATRDFHSYKLNSSVLETGK